MELTPPCWVDIALPSFARNIAHACATLAQDARLMVAVKSDAYGHGEREIAATALKSGAHSLAVLDIDTGVRLRPHVGEAMMLAWLLSPQDDFAAAEKSRIDLGISGMWQLEKIERDVASGPLAIHLKIDTGLHRNGALPADWLALCEAAKNLEGKGVVHIRGIWSHLSDTSLEENVESLRRFHAAVAEARSVGVNPELLHIAASAAATDLPESRLDLVRVGISVYGVSPFDDRSAQSMGFHPVMSPKAFITQVDSEAQTARCGMGYGEGLLTLPQDTGWVSLHGTAVPLHHVDVDHCVLRIPEGTAVAVGDVVTLWGDPDNGSPSAEDWALWAGTIGDEVVSSLSARVERRVIRD